MKDHVERSGVTAHFIARAVERMGCSRSHAEFLGRGILWAIENERWDLVQFVARASRDGRRIFRFRCTQTSRVWYALVNTKQKTCITILRPGFETGREGKSKIKLKEMDL